MIERTVHYLLGGGELARMRTWSVFLCVPCGSLGSLDVTKLKLVMDAVRPRPTVVPESIDWRCWFWRIAILGRVMVAVDRVDDSRLSVGVVFSLRREDS